MELILRNENLIKVKPLMNAMFKCSYGASGTANDFSVELPFEKDTDIKVYRYINYGNTEFGGKILENVMTKEAMSQRLGPRCGQPLTDNGLSHGHPCLPFVLSPLPGLSEAGSWFPRGP